MRVLHVMPSLARSFGGPVHAILGYARAAAGEGIACSVIGPNASHQDAAWLQASLGDVDVSYAASMGKGAFVISPAMSRWLREHARRFDVVHVHGLLNPVSSIAARTCLRSDVPVVIRPFGTLSRFTLTYRRRWLKQTYLRLVDRSNLIRAGAVHFTTQEELSEAALAVPEVGRKGFVVPPPYEWEEDDEEHSRFTPGSALTALYLSRIHPKKNLEALVESWAVVHREFPSARLVIAGDGEPAYVESIERLVSRLGITDAVRFEGFVQGEAKERLFENADLFVLPSFHENFGVAVLEALAHGVPVVISEGVQLASFVREHGVGRITTCEPASIAAALRRALSDEAWRLECRRLSPAIVRENFSMRSVGLELRRMYEAATATISPARLIPAARGT